MRFSLGRAIKLGLSLFFVLSFNLFLIAIYSSESLPLDLEAREDRGSRKGDTHQSNRLLDDNGGLPQNISHKIQSRSARSLSDLTQKRGHEIRDGQNVVGKKLHSEATSSQFHIPSPPATRQLELRDIFISVKTTYSYHSSRLDLLLETWVQHVQDLTYFFTDVEDEKYSNKTKGHMINTNCSTGHSRSSLCCKMSVEFDFFISANKKWFCHVDDDTYINIPALYKLLSQYNHAEDVYLGKPSLSHPIEVADREHPQRKIAFWFATGGAGLCISKGLALKMIPYAGGGRLRTVCESVRLPDDCTLGYIIAEKLGKTLTKVNTFHSHLESLGRITQHKLEEQITLSYKCTGNGENNPYADKNERCNTVKVPGLSKSEDITRLRSVHCLLYPSTAGCPLRAS